MITQEEYLELKEKTKLKAIENGFLSKDSELILTCDDCNFRFNCEFAGDLYNTEGNCLYLK